jgi:hypothetical protein
MEIEEEVGEAGMSKETNASADLVARLNVDAEYIGGLTFHKEKKTAALEREAALALSQQAATIRELKARVVALTEAASKALRQFEFYACEHRKAEADKHKKAATNQSFVDMLDAALRHDR